MQVCDDVAHVLIRQRLARPDLFPIRLSKIRSAGNDDGPQALIAHESKVAGVGDLLLALLMAGGTVHLEDLVALLSGTDGAR
jgi:hypothetical protein